MLEDRIRSAADSLRRLQPEPPPIERLVARRRHRRIAGVSTLAVLALAVAIPLSVLPGGHRSTVKVLSPATTLPVPTTPPISNTSRPSDQANAASTAIPSSSLTTAVPVSEASTLPIVVCPTSFGIAPPPPVSLPATMVVKVPTPTAAHLAVYSDNQGIMKLLAPRGWVCTARYGADGSGGVAVSPSGESIPSSWGAGWTLPASSPDTAIIGIETSACAGCTLGQACPLFSAAATAFQNQFGRSCPKIRPASEDVDQITSGVAGFADPPGVAGDGIPSGGQYPANGVMTYYPHNDSGSYLDTCTLPSSQRQLCTAVLDTFIAWYGEA